MAAKRKGPSGTNTKTKGFGADSSTGKAADKVAEITLFAKSGGILTKRISLAADGSVKSDGSACKMSQGVARRVEVAGVKQLVEVIDRVQPNQAIALGVLKPDLPDTVKVVTKKAFASGAVRSDVIARTSKAIIYRNEHPAFALLDFDTKGMPPDVATELKCLGGFWEALLSVLPALGDLEHLVRRSTSSGLSRSDTGEELPGSDGLHVYVEVLNGADIERFLRVLHARCWLAGLGWMMLGATGQSLERSIVDRMVGSPERLVFEGGPILVPPLQQDPDSRRPVAFDGGELDTIAACPPLSIVEKAQFDNLRAKETHRLAHDAVRVRAAYVEQKAKDMTKHTGMSILAAKHIIERQFKGILLPAVVLPFDDNEFAGCTVADVLADPDRFEGATLADPSEGPDYGRCVAKILRRPDGTPWIHSFAHGRTVYELKYDATAVRSAIEKANKTVVLKTLLDLVVVADLDERELEELRDLVAKRSGAGKQTIKTMLKAAQNEHAAERAEHERKRRAAGRTDPRPQIYNPTIDAPWLPQMQVLNDVLGSSPAKKPPVRNIDDDITRARKLRVPDTHAFTNINANPEE
jgi:hypothetical protein